MTEMKCSEPKYIFELEIPVRDYELDCENIVNNAVYLHYLEHTRHEFCRWAGLSFREMREKGVDPVLNKIEVQYKSPLRSGDVMVSKLWLEMQGARFVFHQDIFNRATGDVCVKAVVSCVCLENGRLSRGTLLAHAFEKYLTPAKCDSNS